MQLILPLVSLPLFWAGVAAQIELKQPKPMVMVSTGEKFTFECRMTGGSMSNYYMYWYRKNPNDASLTFIYNQGGYYGSGFEGAFEGKVDAWNNHLSLKLLRAELGDTGIYYCAARLTVLQPSFRAARKPQDMWEVAA
uniref:Ig-like domain-containing protein n=1 Tax=Ornithorhynchus anatinus TaxID=9258 RepID=A0A6I8P9Y5_ORNAN